MATSADESRSVWWAWRWWLVLLVLLLLIGAGLWAWKSPRVVLLLPDGDSDWIRVDEPVDLTSHGNTPTHASFRIDFHVPPATGNSAPSVTTLRVRALRDVVVSIDGVLVFEAHPDAANWKQGYDVALPSGLKAGVHRLFLDVSNPNGPSLARARGVEVGIASGEPWDASADGRTWSHAIRAGRLSDPAVTGGFGPAGRDVLAMSPLLIALFAIGCIIWWRAGPPGESTAGGCVNWAWRVRWALLLAWVVLAVNNYFKVPAYVGYDQALHLEYIRYVAEHRRLPLPNEGGELFQAPLYYVVSAALRQAVIALGATPAGAEELLRVIPLACGVLMVELCYRTARHAFLERRDLQIIATLVGGLMPMSLYMAPSLSNEPLAGCLTAVVVCLAVRLLVRPDWARSSIAAALCGGALGAAVLTKVSAVLMLPPLCAALALALLRQGAPRRRAARSLAVLLGAALIICGPYFVRNLVRFGTPFYSNATVLGLQWWQYPGYRTPGQLLEFGHVFIGPVYSGTRSVWDALYSTLWCDGFLNGYSEFKDRPPFHFRLMSCGLWLGAVPTVLMILAVARLLTGDRRRPDARIGLVVNAAVAGFAVMTVACFLAAIVYIYLTLPIYSCAKASYMLGATPCLALLAAAGFGELSRYRAMRIVTGGLVCCWAVVAYLTYLAT